MSKYNIFQNIGKKPVEEQKSIDMKATSKLNMQAKLNNILASKNGEVSPDAAILQPAQR